MIIENEKLFQIKRIGKIYTYIEPLIIAVPILLTLLEIIPNEVFKTLLIIGLVSTIFLRITFLNIKQNAIISLLSDISKKLPE